MKKFNGVEQVGAADRNAGGYEMGKGGTAEINRKLNAFLDDRGLVPSFQPSFGRQAKATPGKVQMPAAPVHPPADEQPAAVADEPTSAPSPKVKKQNRPVLDPELAEIGPRIKAALVARGMTQKQLSLMLGYKTGASVGNAIAGYTYHAGVRQRICEALGLDSQGYATSVTTETTASSAPELSPTAPAPVAPPPPQPAPSAPPLPAFDLAAVASATAALNLTLLDYAFAQARYEEAARALRAARDAAEKIGITIHLPAESFP